MRRQFRRVLLSAAVLVWVVVQSGQAAAESRPSGSTRTYALTVLPTLGAAFDANNAAGINDKGWIVGDANAPGSTSIANATEHATVWRHGVITDLGTLGGPNSSIGFVARPNNTGRISGNAQINVVDPFGEGWSLNLGCDAAGDPCAGSQYEVRGFGWRNGAIRALPTLGGNNALAIGGANDQGQIVGTAENAVRDPACTPPQVFEWRAVPTPLPIITVGALAADHARPHSAGSIRLSHGRHRARALRTSRRGESGRPSRDARVRR